MKRSLILLILSICSLTFYAQTFHYYWNSQIGYIEIGFGGKYIQFRYPNGYNPFITLNKIGVQDGLSYYGNNQFRVAINSNSSQACVITNQGSQWFNYVGPSQIPNPYGGGGQSSYNSNNTNTQSRTKCPWCNGGRITKNDHVTQYGLNNYTVTKRCGECGYEYNSTYTNHYHLDCGHCGGTGYIR